MRRVLMIARAEQLCFDAGLRCIYADHEEFEKHWVSLAILQLSKECQCSTKEGAEAARIGFHRAVDNLRTVKKIAANREKHFPPVM